MAVAVDGSFVWRRVSAGNGVMQEPFIDKVLVQPSKSACGEALQG